MVAETGTHVELAAFLMPTKLYVPTGVSEVVQMVYCPLASSLRVVVCTGPLFSVY